MTRLPYGLGAASGAQDLTAAGAMVLSGAKFTGPAAPFVAVAGVAAELLGALGVGAGCGQSCITASAFADKAQPIFYQNLQTYMALPKPRAASAQAAALAVFDALWAGYLQQCATVPGAAGSNCVADRAAGACHYKVNGACWNWFVGFRDPIAHDPDVVPDSQLATAADSLAASVTGGGSGSTWGLLALAAGVVAVLAFS